jgi:hypothetical protein
LPSTLVKLAIVVSVVLKLALVPLLELAMVAMAMAVSSIASTMAVVVVEVVVHSISASSGGGGSGCYPPHVPSVAVAAPVTSWVWRVAAAAVVATPTWLRRVTVRLRWRGQIRRRVAVVPARLRLRVPVRRRRLPRRVRWVWWRRAVWVCCSGGVR